MPYDPLKSWNFLRDEKKHYDELVRQARIVYSVAEQLFGAPPDQDECKILFGKALYESPFYIDQIAKKKKFLPHVCYEAFAMKLAEYVVENNWSAIQQSA